MIQRGGVAGGEEGDGGGAVVDEIAGAGEGGVTRAVGSGIEGAGAGCCGVWKRFGRLQERFFGLFGREEMFFGHDMDQLTGYGGSGVDETDVRPCNLLKDREEERVMGTA